MKKFTALLMITLLAAAMLVPVSATDKPVITLQPQNSVYPEFASALWSVKQREKISHITGILFTTAQPTVPRTRSRRTTHGSTALPGRDTVPTKPGIPSLSTVSEAHLTAR